MQRATAFARFLQADPFVQSPHDSQSWSRYSYTFNNPLAYTDPSGNIAIGDILRTVASIAIMYYAPYLAPYLGGSTAAAYIVGGFAAGAVQSGSLRGAVTGAVTAGVFYGIGGAFTPESAGWAYNASETMKVSGYAVRALSYGMAGGVMAQLQGGKFGHGFVSAGIGSLSPSSQGGRSMGKMVATAVIGGTATSLAGGKFGNGAVTAAFSYAFTSTLDATMRAPVSSGGSTLAQPGPGMPPEPDSQHLSYMRSLAPEFEEETMREKWEYATEIYRSNGEYGDSGLNTMESSFGSRSVKVPMLGEHVSSAHSHPPAGVYRVTVNDVDIVGSGHGVGDMLRVNPMKFSPQDVNNMRIENKPGWVIPVGTGKILYFPINNPGGVHYEYSWR